MCKRQRSKPSSTPCCQLSVTSRVPALSPIPSPTKGGTRGPKSAPRWRWLAKLGRACSRRVGVSGPWRWTPDPCSPGRWLSAVTVLHSPPWLEMAAKWHLLGSSFTCVPRCPPYPPSPGPAQCRCSWSQIHVFPWDKAHQEGASRTRDALRCRCHLSRIEGKVTKKCPWPSLGSLTPCRALEGQGGHMYRIDGERGAPSSRPRQGAEARRPSRKSDACPQVLPFLCSGQRTILVTQSEEECFRQRGRRLRARAMLSAGPRAFSLSGLSWTQPGEPPFRPLISPSVRLSVFSLSLSLSGRASTGWPRPGSPVTKPAIPRLLSLVHLLRKSPARLPQSPLCRRRHCRCVISVSGEETEDKTGAKASPVASWAPRVWPGWGSDAGSRF